VIVRKLTSKNRHLDRSFAETLEYRNESVLQLEDWPVKPNQVPAVAHELMHVIKNICKCRMMSIEKESEHLAYLMQYMLAKITGYEFDV
jgi:ribosome biogenesis protein Nip4